MKLTVTLLAAFAALAAAQEKPKLSLPQAKLCSNRGSHATFGRHRYLKSWNAGAPASTWFHARNWCRDRCMDLVSMETGAENQFVKNMGGRDVWTSGRLCNFNDDCTRDDLQPIKVNGWFWATPGVRMMPTNQGNDRVHSNNRPVNDWSQQRSRCNNQVQPDQCDNRSDEACMTIGQDGRWHDETCHQQKHFICEDSDELIDFTKFKNPNFNI